MKLVKQAYIRNRLLFDETERDILNSAYKIVESVRSENAYENEDDFLYELCDRTLSDISELLDNYDNEYLETCE